MRQNRPERLASNASKSADTKDIHRVRMILGMPKLTEKQRDCIRCLKVFSSQHPLNRMCTNCRQMKHD